MLRTSAPASIGVSYPQKMSWFVGSIPYILAVGTIVLSLVEFFRKLDEYKDHRLRNGVLAILILTGVSSIFSLRHDNEEKEQKDNAAQEDKKEAEQSISTLQRQVEAATKAENTAIQDQKNNTTQFLAKFSQLSDEVNQLKNEATREDLQKKLATVETELRKTQSAMAPPPKAKLTFTFVPFVNPLLRDGKVVALPEPVTDIKLAPAADGSVHIIFTVLNLTDVDALNVALTIAICDECKYAKEPAGFQVVTGDLPNHRVMIVPQLHRQEFLSALSVDVIPAATLSTFTFGVGYRCNSCVLEVAPAVGTVRLLRDFLKDRPLK